ncbi:hypothetical protein TR51_10840 [Kitasatospora griseola]|uniref:Uncharacterized protein n=1 Tax=Kitasatospora griseola TaxID=2064 RepID=A0A0D0N930_KITGR|nr:hypothetical protein [Kitasatospora griseola]KIQ64690.1 hypothetical protein TR51_10840 [Kitasatospora griseola]
MTTGAGPAGGLPPDSVRGAREQITEAVAALLVHGRGLELAAWLMLDSGENENEGKRENENEGRGENEREGGGGRGCEGENAAAAGGRGRRGGRAGARAVKRT